MGRKDTWLRVYSSIITYQRVKMKEKKSKNFICICLYYLRVMVVSENSIDVRV